MSRHSLRIHALRGLGFATAAVLGLAAATWAQSASADGLPVPSVTLPSPPVSSPVPLPTDSGGAQAGSNGSSQGAGAPSASAPAASTTSSNTDAHTPAAVAGAVTLAGGGVSIPVTSVRAPARLVLDWVAFAPSLIRSAEQPLRAAFRVSDVARPAQPPRGADHRRRLATHRARRGRPCRSATDRATADPHRDAPRHRRPRLPTRRQALRRSRGSTHRLGSDQTALRPARAGDEPARAGLPQPRDSRARPASFPARPAHVAEPTDPSEASR